MDNELMKCLDGFKLKWFVINNEIRNSNQHLLYNLKDINPTIFDPRVSTLSTLKACSAALLHPSYELLNLGDIQLLCATI